MTIPPIPPWWNTILKYYGFGGGGDDVTPLDNRDYWELSRLSLDSRIYSLKSCGTITNETAKDWGRGQRGPGWCMWSMLSNGHLATRAWAKGKSEMRGWIDEEVKPCWVAAAWPCLYTWGEPRWNKHNCTMSQNYITSDIQSCIK
jgi:hypothetical protein